MQNPYACPTCPDRASLLAAEPATVRLHTNGTTWTKQSAQTPVHLVAIFREPGISNNRIVSTVLDLWVQQDGSSLAAGRRCWIKPLLKALSGLPPGLTVALDNGVRCPCPQHTGGYHERINHCVGQTQHWLEGLVHPNGGQPGLLLCDKDLACSYSKLGLLLRQEDKQAWQAPFRFIDAVGEEVLFVSGKTTYDGLILAHPVLFSRQHARAYIDAFQLKGVVQRLVTLSRIA